MDSAFCFPACQGVQEREERRTGVHEAGLAHVRVAAHDEGARAGVDGGQAGQMLAHLLQVLQAVVLLAEKRAHPAGRARGG